MSNDLEWSFLMELNALDGYNATFATPDTQHNGERLPTLLLPRGHWREMGGPAQIRVEVTHR